MQGGNYTGWAPDLIKERKIAQANTEEKKGGPKMVEE